MAKKLKFHRAAYPGCQRAVLGGFRFEVTRSEDSPRQWLLITTTPDDPWDNQKYEVSGCADGKKLAQEIYDHYMSDSDGDEPSCCKFATAGIAERVAP